MDTDNIDSPATCHLQFQELVVDIQDLFLSLLYNPLKSLGALQRRLHL